MKLTSLTLLLLTSTTARLYADPAHCSTAEGDLAYTVDDLPDLAADTGWIPSSSPVQVRVAGHLAGTTGVAMALSPVACWDGGMTIKPAGVAGGGTLDMAYGAELTVQGKIHTSVLGHNIDWTGTIPLSSYLPTDLMLSATQTFDPTALPDSADPVIEATSAPTSPVTVLSTNVLSDIISISGISGNLSITAQGALTTSYRTTALAFGNTSITSAAGVAAMAAPDQGFHGWLRTPLSATGVVHYAPSLILTAHASVSILGVSVASWTLTSVTVPLPSIDRDVTLTGLPLAFPLPALATVPTGVQLAQPLALHNAGAAPLVVSIAAAPAGVTAATVTIAPGDDGVLAVTADDPNSVDGAPLVLATNDPDHPQVTVTLGAMTDDGGDMTSDGGCNAGHSSGLALPLLGLALALVRRRRTN